MGHMWMEGLRAGAHKQNQLESPWLKPGDIGVEELGEYQEHDVSLDPVTIYFNSQLGEDNIRSMAIFTILIVFQMLSRLLQLKDGVP